MKWIVLSLSHCKLRYSYSRFLEKQSCRHLKKTPLRLIIFNCFKSLEGWAERSAYVFQGEGWNCTASQTGASHAWAGTHTCTWMLPQRASWPIAVVLHYLLSSHPLLTGQLQPTFEARWWRGRVLWNGWTVPVACLCQREISVPPSHSRPDARLELGLFACLTHCPSELEEK